MLRHRPALAYLIVLAILAVIQPGIAGCSNVQPCSAEDFATGPLALHNASCAARRQASFPNLPDEDCMAKPGCKAIVDECDRWSEERCK
jgi:hypothetical protein